MWKGRGRFEYQYHLRNNNIFLTLLLLDEIEGIYKLWKILKVKIIKPIKHSSLVENMIPLKIIIGN
jgi:hypothetical protein